MQSRVTYSQNTATDTLTSILSGSDTLYRFTYDGLGRTESTRLGTDSSGRLLASYLYDGSTGALQQLTYGNGHTLTYEYDALGRILRKTPTNSAQRSEYVYNDKGRLGILKDYASDTRTKYLYDLAGRVTGVLRKRYVNNDNGWRWGEILYRYEDGTNHLTRMDVRTDYKSYTTNFVYGNIAAGQMPDSVYEVKLNNTKEIQYTYDGLGRLTSRKLSVPNLTATYGYKTVSGNRTSTQLQSVTTAAGTTAYTYDAVGNITAVTNNGTATESYTYDSLNQLTAATMGGVNYAYTYDAGGNILTAGAGGTTHTYAYGDSVWKDLLTAYDGQTITYDTIGNPLTYHDGTAFTWQNGRELAAVTKNGVTTNYVYNADGGRHTKTVGGVVTQYITVDGVLYGEKTGNNTLVYYYDDNGTPYAFTHNNVKYYYEYNIQGDVIGLFDSTGARVVQYTYTPYGALASMTDSTATGVGTLNPIRYRGYYYDAETGLYYCNTRYYDPEIGRWINADGQLNTDAILGHNMFAYSYNNPIMLKDSTGNRPIASMTVKSETKEERTISCNDWKLVEQIEDYNSYLNALGETESSNDYMKVNQLGYMGRYQMGDPALQDVGLKDPSGNWTTAANNYGVYSDVDFLNSPSVQEYAITAYNKKQISYIKYFELDSYIGTMYQGATVTRSGLLASCHLVGVGDMITALRTGKVVRDGNGVPASHYMQHLGNYDISIIWG